jgi:formiminoglutamase
MNSVEITKGNTPIILAMPHTGTNVPEDVKRALNANGRLLADTDWHIDQLYQDLLPGASVVRATFHRYVIDANRDPSGESLYPGQNTTGLCPLTDFDGREIYREGQKPGKAEIERRRLEFHAPYHAALAAEIERVRQHFGIAILYDCHSIRSTIPFLFEGRLPDFNIGTNNGATCAAEIERRVAKVCAGADGFTSIVNGRFKGGWTTRHYGKQHNNIHAIQMELAQSTYLTKERAPFSFDAPKADKLRRHLREILIVLADFAKENSNGGMVQ